MKARVFLWLVLIVPLAAGGHEDGSVTLPEHSGSGFERGEIIEWRHHIHSAANYTAWVSEFTLNITRPHNYTVLESRSALLVSANVNLIKADAGPESLVAEISLDGELLTYCSIRANVRSNSIGTGTTVGEASLFGGSTCPTINATDDEQLVIGQNQTWLFEDVTGNPVNFRANVYLVVQDVVPMTTELDINTALDSFIPFLFWGGLVLLFMTRKALFPALASSIMVLSSLFTTEIWSFALGIMLVLLALWIHAMGRQNVIRNG